MSIWVPVRKKGITERKGYSTQQCLLALLEKWKTTVDKGKVFGDLAKAFDCLNNELLIAKQNAYGLTLPALKLLRDIFQTEGREQE